MRGQADRFNCSNASKFARCSSKKVEFRRKNSLTISEAASSTSQSPEFEVCLIPGILTFLPVRVLHLDRDPFYWPDLWHVACEGDYGTSRRTPRVLWNPEELDAG